MSTRLRLGRASRTMVLALCFAATVTGVVEVTTAAEETAGAKQTPAEPASTQLATTPSGESASGEATSQQPAPSPSSAAPIAPPDDSKIDAATEAMLAQASFSMQLQKAPLLQMLTLLGASSPVRFRYAAPPDAVVTTTLQDAPLLSTLENLLHAVGFITHREGLNIFICRRSEEPRAATTATMTGAIIPPTPVAWQIWTRRVPPPRRWMAPSPLANRPRATTQDQWQMAKNQETSSIGVAWRPARLDFDVRHRPGIAIGAGSAVEVEQGDFIYLRWNLRLEQVPRGAQLLLESPYEATFYVNGAPLLRNFRTIRLVDLSDVLQPGENCLAIALRRNSVESSSNEKAGGGLPGLENQGAAAQAAGVAITDSGSAASAVIKNQTVVKPPILRYEWFFGGDVS